MQWVDDAHPEEAWMSVCELPWSCPGCGDVRPWAQRTCACGFDADLFSKLALRIALEAHALPAAAIPLLIDLSLRAGSLATSDLTAREAVRPLGRA